MNYYISNVKHNRFNIGSELFLRAEKLSTETLVWLQSTGSALPVTGIVTDVAPLSWQNSCTAWALLQSTASALAVCGSLKKGKMKRGVHMRALSRCSLELYVRDTVFQASIYRSIHMAIHFC